MTREITNRKTTFDRVDRFCSEPDIVLPPGGQALLAELQAIITQIENYSRDQVSGRGEGSAGTSARFRTAATLRRVMRLVAMVAKRLPKKDYPGLAQRFVVPRSSSFPGLLASARAFVESLTPELRPIFADHLGEAFLDKIPALIAEFEGFTDRKNAGRLEQVTGTAGLSIAAARGLAIVRALEPVMAVVLWDDPAKMVAWKGLSRVERRRRSSEGDSDEAQPTESAVHATETKAEALSPNEVPFKAAAVDVIESDFKHEEPVSQSPPTDPAGEMICPLGGATSTSP
jgi:hypothetical protein